MQGKDLPPSYLFATAVSKQHEVLTMEFLKVWALWSLLLPMEDKWQRSETKSWIWDSGPDWYLVWHKGVSSWYGIGKPEDKKIRGLSGAESPHFPLNNLLLWLFLESFPLEGQGSDLLCHVYPPGAALEPPVGSALTSSPHPPAPHLSPHYTLFFLNHFFSSWLWPPGYTASLREHLTASPFFFTSLD